MTRRRLAALVLGAVLASGTAARAQTPQTSDDRDAASASADYIDRRLAELERLTKALDHQRSSLQSEIAAKRVEREALTAELEEFAALLGRAQARVDVAGDRLASVQRRLDANTAELNGTQAALALRIARLRRRAVTIYKNGPVSIIGFLLDAGSIGDLVTRLGYAMRLAHVDNAQVADIKRERRAIVHARDAIASLRDAAAREAASVQAARDRAAMVKSAADQHRGEITSELADRFAELGDIEAQKRAFAAEEAELQRESASIAAFLKGQSDTPPTVSPKGMSWPVRGPITSGYGWREHPIFHTRRFHSGIDIAAPSGTPIGAAASGKVVFVGEKTGYGNTVIVYHGGGIATLYGHQSAIVAGMGALVTRGQTIGRVGCTGYCTGPHLHFEVRVNGETVEPLAWLP